MATYLRSTIKMMRVNWVAQSRASCVHNPPQQWGEEGERREERKERGEEKGERGETRGEKREEKRTSSFGGQWRRKKDRVLDLYLSDSHADNKLNVAFV